MVGGSSPAVGLDPPELYSNNWFLVLLRLQILDFKIAFRFKICFKGRGTDKFRLYNGRNLYKLNAFSCVKFLIHI